MKYLVIVFSFIAIMLGFSSCSMRNVPGPARTFVIPEHRVRHHWGLRRREMSVHRRYWGHRRYGPRPHPHRGVYR